MCWLLCRVGDALSWLRWLTRCSWKIPWGCRFGHINYWRDRRLSYSGSSLNCWCLWHSTRSIGKCRTGLWCWWLNWLCRCLWGLGRHCLLYCRSWLVERSLWCNWLTCCKRIASRKWCLILLLCWLSRCLRRCLLELRNWCRCRLCLWS